MSDLPIALQIVAKATQIDNIKVVPIDRYDGNHVNVTVVKIGNWKKRLLNKAVDFLNLDIAFGVSVSEDPILYVYSMGELKEGRIFATIIMKYTIKC